MFRPQVNAQNPNNDLELPTPPSDSVSQLRWSPTANLLSASSWDKTVRVWSVELTGQVGMSFGHEMTSPILANDWHSSGSSLFVATLDGKVHAVDLNSKALQQVAQHQVGLQTMQYIPELSLLATGGWDKMLHYWDLRQQQPALSVPHQHAIYALDCRHPLLITSDAKSNVAVFNLAAPTQVYKNKPTPLKHASRTVACMIDRSGFVIAAAEGRCAVQYIEDANMTKNFSFRCHRNDDTHVTYAVNDISFHPVCGTFATCGSDGAFNFWDHTSKAKLKAFGALPAPLTAIRFNAQGTMCAYAQGYDWHKGVEGTQVQQPVKVFVQAVDEKDVTARAAKPK
jgi:mRNA export factor